MTSEKPVRPAALFIQYTTHRRCLQFVSKMFRYGILVNENNISSDLIIALNGYLLREPYIVLFCFREKLERV